MGEFATWNNRLLNYFFSPSNAGEPVRLSVSADLLDDEMQDLGGTRSFLRVVRQGPDWSVQNPATGRGKTLIDRALGLRHQWKQLRPSDYVRADYDGPPYLPYLCLLCLPWTTNEELDANAYYEPLEKLYPEHGLSAANLGQLRVLWDDLEWWSVKIENGKYGAFKVETLDHMGHVGIPKSQVVLTQHKINKLPGFFHRAGFAADGSVSEDDLRSAVLDDPDSRTLGRRLGQEIRERTLLGNFALTLLREQFLDWDGSYPPATTGADGSRDVRGGPGRLLLGLKHLEGNRGWRATLHARFSGETSGEIRLSSGGAELRAVLEGYISGPLLNHDGQELILAPDSGWWTATKMIAAVWKGDDGGSRNILLQPDPRRIKVLNGNRELGILLEEEAISAGGVYLLVSAGARADWDRWTRSLPHGAIVTDYTGPGLPPGSGLFHLAGLSQDSPEMKLLPDGGEARARLKALRLEGGSRIRRTGSRRTYLPYDLPWVALEAGPEAEVSATGAVLEELVSNTSPRLVQPRRWFKLLPNENARIITITATKAGAEIGRVTIGLLSNPGTAAVSGDRVCILDPTGRESADGEGLRGAFLNTVANPFPWDQVPELTAAASIPVGLPQYGAAACQFLELLRLKGKLSFPEAREKLYSIAKRGDVHYRREFLALRALGHLDILADSRGRWSYVFATPFALVVLPWRKSGKFLAVVSGAPLIKEWSALRDVASQLCLEVETAEQPGHVMVPPRMMVAASALDDLALLADEAKAMWDPVPAAWKIAGWAGDLALWETRLDFREVPENQPEKEYLPPQFATKPVAPRNGQASVEFPDRLLTYPDLQTLRHEWHRIISTRGGSRFSAFVPERAWGRWKVHVGAMQYLMGLAGLPAEKIRLPHTSRGSCLVMPHELELPAVLSRAAALSSGLAPQPLAEGHPAFADGAGKFVPGPGYAGACLAYPFVPYFVAEMLLGKLSATPERWPAQGA